ncbi:MAG: ABC transporter permease [Thermoproteales archaeon]|nr:ABC transporter permease [Thermoproteales archaeon]
MQLEKTENSQSINGKYLKGIMSIFLELYATASRGYKIYFRYTAWFIADLITTPIWILVFLLPILMFLPKEQWNNPTTINFFFWAMVMWDIVGAGLWSFGQAIRREQQTGTLEFLFLTNANRIIMFTRSIFTRGLELTIMFAYMVIVFKLLFGVDIILRNILGVIFILTLGLLIAMGFGEIYGALVLRFKNIGPVTNILEFVILGISGIFFPISRLPDQIRLISLLSPFTYIAEMTRYMAMGIETYLDPGFELILMILMAIIFNAIGFVTILYIEKNLKKTGKLGAY